MTPQEREVINSIFERLKAAANQPRDPEAERYIAGLVAQQPYATYALAQSVYVQEQALTNLQAEIDGLRGEVARLQQAAQAAQPQSGGFLSGIFGGGARPQAPAPQQAPWGGQPQRGMPMQQQAPQGGPWGGAPQQPAQAGPWGRQAEAQQPQRGGFLGSALTTAAGVAGGMVVGNMLMNAFKGPGAGAPQSASSDFQPMNQPTDQSSFDDQRMLDQAEAYDAGYDDGGEDDSGSYEA
ncbi:MAG: DUF2076 domain-containing protein [Proteobacteria bacterium]|nr:DUF2076 domain-containing protein [Pseudomonadota bacterium]